jgi:hypothetical protein
MASGETMGALTIKRLPTGPPGLAPIKLKSKWSKQGNHDLEDTLSLAQRYSTKVREGTAEYIAITDAWAKIFRDIPSIIQLLRPELRLAFGNVELDVPMLQCSDEAASVPNADDAEPEKDALFLAYQRAYLGVRSKELAIDPVISSEQTEAQYKVLLRVHQLATRGRGASTGRTSAVLNGEFIFATSGADDMVSLFKVITLGKMMTPTSVNLQVTLMLAHAHTRYQTRHERAHERPNTRTNKRTSYEQTNTHTHTHTHTHARTHTQTHTHTHTGHLLGV